MSIATTDSRIQYSPNGITVDFDYPYLFYSDTDLSVWITDEDSISVKQTLNVDYTVTGAGDSAGGTVTFGIAPLDGVTLTIYRDMSFTQDLDLVNGEGFEADSLERSLDRTVMYTQQLADNLGRAMILPATSTESPPDPETYISNLNQIAANAEAAATASQMAQGAAASAADVASLAVAEAEAARDEAYAIVKDGLPAAAEGIPGIIKTATAASLIAGTATDEAATPATLHAASADAPAANVFVRTGASATLDAWISSATPDVPGKVYLATSAGAPLGTASAGTSSRVARADHVHPMDGVVGWGSTANTPTACRVPIADPYGLLDAWVTSASAEQAGLLRFCTPDEASALCDSVAITPFRLHYALNAFGDAPLFAVRAYISFHADGSMWSAGNVSSVTRIDTGRFQINFTSAMPHAYYVVTGTAVVNNSWSMALAVVGEALADGSYVYKTANAVQVVVSDNNSDTVEDPVSCNIAIIC